MSPSWLGALLFFLQVAACLALHARPEEPPALPLPETAERPAHLLESWELSRLAQAKHGSRRVSKLKRDDPDWEVMDLIVPGMCFPEPLDRMVRENWDALLENVERGREEARKSKVVFAGLIRNAGAAVQNAYMMMRRIGRQFMDYRFVLLENDSDDDTADQLRRISQDDRKFVFRSKHLGMQNTRGQEPDRMERMATLRNMLHDDIRRIIEWGGPEWNLVVMYDFDLNLFGENVVTPHGFLDALGRPSWDVMCANSLRHHNDDADEPIGYHDCFAFRPVNNDAYDQWNCGSIMGRRFFKDYEPTQVKSCFGGLALYKSELFLQCRYDPSVYDCEHVPFNECIRNESGQDRVFMDSMLTTTYDSNIPMKCKRLKNPEMQDDPYYSA